MIEAKINFENQLSFHLYINIVRINIINNNIARINIINNNIVRINFRGSSEIHKNSKNYYLKSSCYTGKSHDVT